MAKKAKYDSNGNPSSSALRAYVKAQVKPGTEAGPTGATADWSKVDGRAILGAVIAVTSQRGALLLGCDRIGFLYSVAVYCDGERTARYFHPVAEFQDLEDHLWTLASLAETAPDGQ